MKKILLLLFISFLAHSSWAQSVSSLNNYLSTYSHSIKVNNPLDYENSSCIYNVGYIKASLEGKYLVLSFGFAYDWDHKGGYIDKDIMEIDLSTASFYNGRWSKMWGGKWEQYGDKKTLTIEDKNGMDVTITDVTNLSTNKGTRQTIVSKLRFDLGTEPIANRILNELYSIQEKYKAKEPWLLPEPEPEPEPQKAETTHSSQKKGVGKPTASPKSKSSNNTKKTTVKKYGKYGQ